MAVAACVHGVAAAQSASHGKTLYGFYCQVCHSPDPATMIAPFNLIMTAANNPAQIAFAAATWPSQMGFIPGTLSASDQADVAAYLGTFAAAPATVGVVEFYDRAQDHYFITAAPAEIADLDSGVHAGWARTGLAFNAYAQPAGGASAVCRFYIPPALGDSHFVSASATECTAVRGRFPAFMEETPTRLAVALPDVPSGACPPGTSPVYRIWNARADSNHRYVTDPALRDAMVARGGTAEGYGPAGVAFCAPG